MGLFKKKNGKTDVASPDGDSDEVSAVLAAAAIASSEDDDLAIVIAAAIAAFEAEQYTPTLAIRKTDRTAGVRPVWGVLGTTESIDVRRV